MIKIRPLIQVLGKIIKLPRGSYIDPESLGSGTPDGTNFLRGDGTWAAAGGAGSIPHGTATGTDTYAVTITGITSYSDGDAFLVRFTNGNTTGCTLNINSIGAKTLYRNNDGPIIGGDILDGAEMLCIYNSSLDIFQAIGTSPNTLLAYVTNADSVTITKGQPVYAFGGTGDRLRVKRAFNTSDSTSAQTVGLVLSTSIAANQKGFIIVSGLLDGLSILPTSTWADGDPVYLGATAGTITNVKPSAPNHLVYIGFVTTASNGSAGRLYVRVQNGYEMDEIHDVAISSPTNGQTLTYESATSLWKNTTPATGITIGTTPITSGTDGRILFQAGSVVEQSSLLFWDDANKRLGVGAPPASTVRLDVRAQGALSTDVAFRVRNSADTVNLASIQGDGVLNLAYLADTSRIAINSTTSGQAAIAIGSGNSGLRTVSVGYNNVASGQNGVVIGQGNTAASGGSCGIIVGYNNNHIIGTVVGKSNSGSSSLIFGNSNSIGGSGPTNNNVIAIGNGMTETSGNAKLPHTFMFGSYATTGNKAGLSFRSNNINHLLLGYDIMSGSYSSTTGTNWIGVANGTAPSGQVDAFQQYSADIVAGNAAPHFRTENGGIIKLYKETTSVTASTLVSNLGLPLTDTDTFDGYTLKQVVKALRNQGLLT